MARPLTVLVPIILAGLGFMPATAGATAPPYAPTSAWNTPIASSPTISPSSSAYIHAISDNGIALSSDPDQYTIPVYTVSSATPTVTVTGTGSFGSYDSGDSSRVGHGSPWTITGVPVPSGAVSGTGIDAQIELVNPSTGVEYGFFQFSRVSSTLFKATNGYRYHTTSGYYGRFADGKAGRGDGTPYLTGLVRAWEVAQGHIDHALAFGYTSPAHTFVYPASKTDGAGVLGVDLPDGAHLQLDPSLTDAQLTAMGLNPTARIIARALQRYGMFVVDNSGASKVYLEARSTAGWGTSVTAGMLSGIPWSKFRVVSP
jgi:hypothetical protein